MAAGFPSSGDLGKTGEIENKYNVRSYSSPNHWLMNQHGRALSSERIPQKNRNGARRGSSDKRPWRGGKQNNPLRSFSTDRSSNHENHSRGMFNRPFAHRQCRTQNFPGTGHEELSKSQTLYSPSSGEGTEPLMPSGITGTAHRRNTQDSERFNKEFIFGYNRLTILAKKDSNEIVMEMTNRKSDFCNLMKEKLSPDKVMLVAEMLAKMTASTMLENKTALLVISFQPHILEMLASHSLDIVIKDVKYTNAAIINYFQNLAVFYKDCIEILANTAIDILKEHLDRTIMGLQSLKNFKKINVSVELDQLYADLSSTLASLETAGKSCTEKKIKTKEHLEWKPPGTNFREVCTFPLPQDVLHKSEVQLSPIVVEGPYKSVEHYLNVQFQLMREDFIIPLRDGIMNFVEQRSAKNSRHKRVENVRFYEEVEFLTQFVEGDTLVSEVLFDPRGKCARINWKRSKKFMYGSLICFSSDLYKTLFLGLITNRDVDLLSKGILQCELIGEVQERNLFGKKFIMAENEVYFEAYHHVLNALKNFNETNFPLKDYIINVSSEVILPDYLALNMGVWYDFDRYDFQVINRGTWPSKNQLKVNDSQFEALYSALNQKLVVIQGPPGTGKTYLGLLIAKILLENKKFWRSVESRPILVVCYTNHALDQFLEGILKFTRNIVRVGGQSRNENMAIYNLKNKRREHKSFSYGLSDIEHELRSIADEINQVNGILKELGKKAGIISLKYLVAHMSKWHSTWFYVQGEFKDSLMVEWLLEGSYENYTRSEGEFPIPDYDVINYASTLKQLEDYISYLHYEMVKVDGDDLDSLLNVRAVYESRYFYFKRKLVESCTWDTALISQLNQVRNLSQLDHDQRWAIYDYWLSKVTEEYHNNLNAKRIEYQVSMKRKSEITDALSLRAMCEADVVGITTTGAARQQTLLQKLGARIVIVEEAAEVMESHVIVSLSDKCEHLILIGDHKQLRPSPAVYRLAKDYYFDISFFERMLKNNVPYNTLEIQHRMRPEIADLIIPAIYPALKNHESVLCYDNILGIQKNLFFITHSNPEEQVELCLSKRNNEEAKFLIALSRHIILQGYDPSQITILTVYLGQMFTLMEERDKHAIIKDVKITCVDNFQGEENDIILLSLVRSNEEGKIGFLATENRVCVALSRAKKAFYVMGNMELLSSKSSLWKKVSEVLEKKEAIGSHLKLQCVKHPAQLTEVCRGEDFIPITEGGCTLMCNTKLNCGHICKKMCHMSPHENYKCLEICKKIMCIYNHKCKKLCWEACGDCMVPLFCELPCGHWATLPCHKDPSEHVCNELVEVQFPECEHKTKKKCFQKVEDISCPWPCDSRLPCGHICEKKCHVTNDPDHLDYKCLRPCGRTNLNCKEEHMCQKKCFQECSHCTFIVKRKLTNCVHFHDMECSTDPDSIVCKRPCKKKLPCGHKCPMKCFEDCGGCPIMVDKEIEECKHKIKIKCCAIPERRMCKSKCERFLSCGHECKSICGLPCTSEKCEVLLLKSEKSPCGHDVRLFCREVHFGFEKTSLLKRCFEPCSKILECSHRCKGTCGSCLQGKIHVICQEKCGKNLICGHQCKVSCSQSCPPCKELCFIKCQHTSCKKICGIPCAPCAEKCDWNCEHHSCNKQCGQLCDRPPCDEPCKKKLKCGHSCIGFCGEMCPPLCRVCDAEKVEEIADFLPSDDENPRFVFLPECKHTFDGKGLDKWLSMSKGSIKMVACPQCTTPIQNAYRYGNIIKQHFRDVMKVKTKVFGGLKNNKKNLLSLSGKLYNSIKKIGLTGNQQELQKLRMKLEQRAPLNAFEVNSLEARSQFVLAILDSIQKVENILDSSKKAECIINANVLIKVILRHLEFISPQEHSDINGECMRFQLLMQLSAIESTPTFKSQSSSSWGGLSAIVSTPIFKSQSSSSWGRTYEECRTTITSLMPFQQNLYEETQRKLDELFKILRGPVGISKFEMLNVVKALNLHQGHWYTCPNGHVYVIDDCGRAMVESRCNECGERIGGSHHRELHTNTRLSAVPQGI